MGVGKAAEGRRSPRPAGHFNDFRMREASWSASALWRFASQLKPATFLPEFFCANVVVNCYLVMLAGVTAVIKTDDLLELLVRSSHS